MYCSGAAMSRGLRRVCHRRPAVRCSGSPVARVCTVPRRLASAPLVLVEAAGGPAYYTDRDMQTSHRGMGISRSDWEVFLTHTRAMLADFGVGERERSEVLGFLDTLEGGVVRSAAG